MPDSNPFDNRKEHLFQMIRNDSKSYQNQNSNTPFSMSVASGGSLLTLILFGIIQLLSCQSVDLNDTKTTAKSHPLHINRNLNSGFLLNDKNEMLKWNFTDNEKISLESFHEDIFSFNINTDGIMMIDKSGEVWTYHKPVNGLVLRKDIFKNRQKSGSITFLENALLSKKIEKYDDPIVKAMPFKQGVIMLSH